MPFISRQNRRVLSDCDICKNKISRKGDRLKIAKLSVHKLSRSTSFSSEESLSEFSYNELSKYQDSEIKDECGFDTNKQSCFQSLDHDLSNSQSHILDQLEKP